MARCPAVTSSPISSAPRPRVRCRIQPSWMFVRAPMRIGPTSPRTTHPYQMLVSSPRTTSPTTTAVGATKADAGTTGERPGSAAIKAASGAGRRRGSLEILGIPLPEVLGVHLFEVAPQLLGLLLGALVRRRRVGGLP